MSEAPAETPAARKRRRFWLTVGEAAAVLAVIIAALNYWDSHREHAQSERQATRQASAKTVLVLRGAADADGRRIVLDSLDASQAIQSQRYYFPGAVLGHAMEVSAARPQIDLGWIADGLGRALEADRAPADGESRLPVAITTTYVQDGATHVDRSLYEVGYAWRSKLLARRKVTLQGIALVRRDLKEPPQTAADQRWTPPTG